jgi:uncharacterized protein YacL (UPF0231 family)
MATAPVLNSVSFNPSDISFDQKRIGINFQAINGARRTVYRGTKRDISINWKQVSLTVLNALRTIALLSTTFTLTDENGTNYTVFCPADEVCLTSNVATILADNTVEYDVTLKVWEA